MFNSSYRVVRSKFIYLALFGIGFIILSHAIKSDAAKESVIYDENQKYKVEVQKLLEGDGIIKILERHSVSSEVAHRAYGTHPLSDDFRFIKGNRYLVFKSVADESIKLRFYCPYSDKVYTFTSTGTEGTWKTDRANLDIEVQYTEGSIEGSLVASINSKIPDDLVAYRFMDAYLLDFNLRKDIQRGAHFSLHVEKQFDHGKFIRYGEILNTSLEIKGNKEDRNFIRYPGGGTFVDPKGSHDARPLYAPVNYLKISSTFKPRRFHPIKRKTIAHLGIDFALPEGTPIFAPQNGVVYKTGKNRAAGRFVAIKHGNSYISYFNHMSAVASDLYVGKKIKAGQKVGEIGCTGYCTLPHLHFAVKKKGRFIDPAPLLRSYSFENRLLFEHKKIY